nr:MAG TPA: hypothetical protein [Caudoviricetes sp.]
MYIILSLIRFLLLKFLEEFFISQQRFWETENY